MRILIGNKYYTMPEIELYIEWCKNNGFKAGRMDSLKMYRDWQKENDQTITRHGIDYHIGDVVYHMINGKKMTIVSMWAGTMDCKDEEHNIWHVTSTDITHNYQDHVRFIKKVEVLK